MLSTDGSEGNAYTFNSIRWSPDSKKITAFRRRPGYERLVHYVESSPTDQVQPKHTTNFYRKPGDVVDFDHPVVFNVETKQQMLGDLNLFPNPYANSRLEWRAGQPRGDVRVQPARPPALSRHRDRRDDGPDAALDRGDAARRSSSTPASGIASMLADGKEIIWASERDGWNHLYLYDGATGQVKNQITKGQWVVRGVDYVDEANRQIWFRASGMHAGKDPYYIHYFRINFDGTGLTPFTSEDGMHTVTFSPDRQYYVDTWSRVDLPPSLGAEADERSGDGAGAREGATSPRSARPAGSRRKCSWPRGATARRTSGASSSGRPTSIPAGSIRSSRTSTPDRRAHSCPSRGARRPA